MTSLSDRNYSRHHDTRHDTRPWIDQIAADTGNALWLLGRVMIGIIFVQSGFEKLMDLGGFATMLGNRGVPMAEVLAPIGASIEFCGGLAIVLGLGARYAALLMIAFVITATGISHRFWEYPAAQQQGQFVNFVKNVAIIGGFLFVFVTGGGHYSLDRWWRRH
jgi:putative oxidoreductase